MYVAKLHALLKRGNNVCSLATYIVTPFSVAKISLSANGLDYNSRMYEHTQLPKVRD